MQILPRRSTPPPLAAIPTSNAAAQVRRNWADITEEVNPGAEEGFTLVQGRKRRRGSGNSPTTAAPSFNAGASGTIRRPQSSAGSVPRAQEIRATRAHIADARARQASSSEEHCVYIEHSPELEPFHYLRALDRKLGGTAGVIQITKVNGHQLLGLTNRGLAERLISEGLEVEGTLLRAFPFRKRAERITVGNLPFFVADSAVITALSPFGRVTSIAPKQMKAGPYVYVDGRRDVFITLHEGITIERLPTRLDINIKGQAWPAYLSSGIRCSRCHGQGHRRAICPLLAGLANNTRMAPPTTPAGVPPPTTSAPPQRSAVQPPAPAPSNLAMEVCNAPPMARAVLHPSAPRPSPPAAPALPMEETPSSPPPVIPAPSLQVPKNPVDPRSATPRHPEPTPPARPDFAAPRGPPPIQETLGPAAPTQDVEMSIVEETTASSASSTRNATGDDLVAFIEGNPSVSFARTDALGLGREEVLDLLSSRTKAQRNGPLLSPPQCDALVGLIGQILDLKPGHTSNLYKVLGQVRAELTKTPAAATTPPLPAPRPTGPTPPVPHEEQMTEEQEDVMIFKIFRKLKHMTCLRPLYDTGIDVIDLKDAILFTEDRASLMTKLSPALKGVLAEFLGAAIELARSYHHDHGPELQPFHYLRTLDRLLGGTAGVVQVSKVNGHQLLGLANRGLAERLINNGLEVEGTLLRAFPFRKRAERITVGNLPFFVEDSAIIKALGPYGRITSIAPKMMKAGPYTYTDGHREAFIVLHEGVTTERLPTRLNITIKGEAWPAYLSSGIKCSRCHGKGHRRANCPLLAGRTTAPGPATPTSPTSVPPATAPRLPQQSSARPPPPASPSPTMEVSDVPPTSRAALHPPEALRQSPPAPSALPAEDAPPAPPPVTPAPSPRTPGSREPAAPTPDVEMSIVEETFASSTSSAKNATRVDLDAFIEGLPSVSFAKTNALGLGREEVLDLLSSRTKAQRKGPLLSPPQCDALVGLIGQILDLKPGHTSNLYKVLGQVRAELTKTPAAAPTPPLPAPGPDGPIPPPPHGDTTTPDMATPPPPPSAQMEVDPIDKRCKELQLLTFELMKEFNPKPLPQFYSFELDLVEAGHGGPGNQGYPGRHRRHQSTPALFNRRQLRLRRTLPGLRVHPLPAGGGRASRGSRERPPGDENGRPYAGRPVHQGSGSANYKGRPDIGHTHLRAFPFKKRAERITVGNLPFFVGDAAVIEALKPYGDVTSIVPIRLRAGRYTFTDGRREAFILLKEGIALEKIPTRVVIRNKGNVLPAFISYGVKCSRCGRQDHHRANCPINPRRASNNGQPQPATHPPGASSTVSRQPNPSTPAAPALPMEETPSAPPPVIPAPSLQAPEGPVGPRSANSQHPEPPPARPDFVAPRNPLPAQKTLGPAAPTPDVEMSIVEETSASSTSSAKNATRFDLDAFIERHPTVSFAGTDALGLGREEVLDLLSSRTKAQRNGPLLSPPQCDALAGLIRQILDLRPGAASNLYKVLGQVKAELRTTPAAVPPTPPLPAPRPAEPMLPTTHREELTPPLMTPPPPAPTDMEEDDPMTVKERGTPSPPAPRPAEPTSPALHISTHVYLDQVKAELRTTPAVPPTPPLPAPRPFGPTPPTSHSEELMPAVMTPPPPALTEMEEDNPITEKERCVPPPPAPRLAEPTPPAPIGKREIYKENSNTQEYANPPADGGNVNLAAARVDVTSGSAATLSSNSAALAIRNWADYDKDMNPGTDNDFTVVKTKKRRRESSNSPTAAAPSSNSGGARSSRRLQSSARSVPRAQEIPTTRAHITEARARQASSSEEHCVYLVHGPELQPFHYLRALDRLLGGTAGIIQISKVLWEHHIHRAKKDEGRPVHLHRRPPRGVHRPPRRSDNREAPHSPRHHHQRRGLARLSLYRHQVFQMPRRGGAGRVNTTSSAPPASPAGVPPSTAPAPPQRPTSQHPAPAPPLEISRASPAARAAIQPAGAPRPSPTAPPASPAEETPSAPPPVTPAPSLQAPEEDPRACGPNTGRGDSIVEETSASSTSSAKNATRNDLDAFIERHPSVSFAGTDALGLGREEALDLLSSRTRAQRKGPLLSPPQGDAFTGLIKQNLDLRPGAGSNIYKVLGQVKAELRTTPAAVPTPPLPASRPSEPAPLTSHGKQLSPALRTPPLPAPAEMEEDVPMTEEERCAPPPPAPRLAGPIPPVPHGDSTTPDMATPPPPLSTQMDRALMDKRWEALRDSIHGLNREFELDLEHRFQSRVDVDDIIRAILYPGEREPLIKRLPTRDRYTLGGFMSTAIRRARELDPFVLE
ncbi:hypothetical protein LAZ67_15003013, partial [Cordylochernes scorpioides]